MAKRDNWDDVDAFVLGRWPEVREVSRVYRRTIGKMRRRLEHAGKMLLPSLTTDGYRLDVNDKDAELNIFKASWCNADDEAVAVLSISAIYPMGYINVDEPQAFIGVWFWSDLQDEQARFAAALKSAVPDTASWHSEPDEEWPLWRYVDGWDDQRRAALALSKPDLVDALKGQLGVLRELDGPVTAALQAIKR